MRQRRFWHPVLLRNRARRADSLLTAGQHLTASAVAALVTDMRSWIHRRVEVAELVDDVAVVRRSSIDFTVPESLNGVRVGPALRELGEGFVPITFLAKELLRNFDLRDSDGRPLPMLSRRDNGALATNVLVSYAETVLRHALPKDMHPSLQEVAEAPPDVARRSLDAWRSRRADDHRHPRQAEWAQLTDKRGFMALSEALAEYFIVCSVMEPSPSRRRIVKLSYEEPFGVELPHALAWRWTTLELDARSSRLAGSYHFELAAPPDMEAGGALLHFEASPDAGDPTPPDHVDAPEGQRVHLYGSSVPSGVDARAYVFLRPRREGNLRAALLTGMLSTLLLWVGYVELEAVADAEGSQVSAALLLLGPTLLAGALVRPGEHQLVTRAFFWVRVLTVGCMVALLAGVGLLSGAFEGQRDPAWLASAVLATICSVGLAVAYALPRAP